MTTRDTAKRAIVPGSLPYGERTGFEAAIDRTLGGTRGAAPASVSPPAGVGAVLPRRTPLDFLLKSKVFKTSLPVTAGLSVGPGPGPSMDLSGLPLDRMARLQEIALNARSPVLRSHARILLRELARRGG